MSLKKKKILFLIRLRNTPWLWVFAFPVVLSVPIILWYLLRIIFYVITFIMFGEGSWHLDTNH